MLKYSIREHPVAFPFPFYLILFPKFGVFPPRELVAWSLWTNICSELVAIRFSWAAIGTELNGGRIKGKGGRKSRQVHKNVSRPSINRGDELVFTLSPSEQVSSSPPRPVQLSFLSRLLPSLRAPAHIPFSPLAILYFLSSAS